MANRNKSYKTSAILWDAFMAKCLHFGEQIFERKNQIKGK